MTDTSESLEPLLAHAGWLRDLAHRLVGEAAADDVVQEVWLRAATRSPGAIESPRGWLATVLRSVHGRGRARGTAAVERERLAARDEALPSAAELAGRADAQRQLVEALVGLPEPWRRTLLLHFFEGHSAAEIARRDDEPATTVRTRIAKGLVLLRERLDRRPGGREGWLSAMALLLPPERAAGPSALFAATSLPLIVATMWKALLALSAVLLVGWLALRDASPGQPQTSLASDPSSAAPSLEVSGASIGAEPDAPPPARDPLEANPAAPLESASRTSGEARLVLEGVVLDLDGTPVPGAVVRNGTLEEVALRDRGYGGELDLRAESDQAGTFSLALAPARAAGLEVLVVTAHLPGLAGSDPVAVPLDGDGAPAPVRLQLRPGAELSGRVWGLDGDPIGGREVQVASPNLGEFRRVTTEADGRFKLTGLNPGPWRAATMPNDEELAARDEATGYSSALGHLAQAEFRLSEGASTEIELGRVSPDSPRVWGRVVQGGRAVQGPMQWYRLERPMEKQVCMVEADGSFEIDLPVPGRWVAHANGIGNRSRGKRVLLELGPGEERELELTLDGPQLSGRVVDPSGAPLKGVRVEARAESGVRHQPMPTIGGGTMRTNAKGEYAFGPIPEGRWVVIAHGADPEDAGTSDPDDPEPQTAATVGAPVTVDASGGQAADLVVGTQGSRVKVRVRDGFGRPAAASLWFHDAQGVPLNPMTWARTGSDGTATSPLLPLGAVSVSASNKSGASAAVQFEAGVELEVDLQLGPPRFLEVDGIDLAWTLTKHLAVVDGQGRQWGGLHDPRRVFDAEPARAHPERALFGPLPFGEYTVRCAGRETTVRLDERSPEITTATLEP